MEIKELTPRVRKFQIDTRDRDGWNTEFSVDKGMIRIEGRSTGDLWTAYIRKEDAIRVRDILNYCIDNTMNNAGL